MKILSFGEIIWDIYSDKKCIGGAPFNFAAHCARLGAESYLLSAAGDDELGVEALKIARGFGIKDDYIQTVNGSPTGRCLVTLDKNKVPNYDIVKDSAYDYIQFDKDIENNNFDVFCFETLIQRSENNVETIKEILKKVKFKEIFCDLNIRKPFYNEKSIRLCLENASIAKISREELPVVTNTVFGREITDCAVASKLISLNYKNINIIIITLGSDGAYVYDSMNKKEYYHEGETVRVVSTVGAGDSFSAAFVSEYLPGGNIESALDKAVKLSAYVVAHAQAIPE